MLPGDSGVTDLLLHHCDHAFRVPEVLHWLSNAGLRLVEYCDKDQFNKLPESFRDPESKPPSQSRLAQSRAGMAWISSDRLRRRGCSQAEGEQDGC